MSRSIRLNVVASKHIIDAVLELGENLKVARLRRGLSLLKVAKRLGITRQLVADAEQGKLSTSIAVYAALLYEYDLLLPSFFELACPSKDIEGLRLLNMRTSSRAKKVDENAPRFRSSREDYFRSYLERYDSLDEGY